MNIINPDGRLNETGFVVPPREPDPLRLASRKCSLCDAWIAVGVLNCDCFHCSECSRWVHEPHVCPVRKDIHAWLKVPLPDPDSSPEVEDEVYVFAGYRLMPARKENKLAMDRFHVILTPKGAPEDIKFFYFLLSSIDKDMKYRPDLPDQKVQICQRCHGFVWDRALLGPSEIKRAAKQCSIEVKVSKWKKAHKCRGQILEMPMTKVEA